MILHYLASNMWLLWATLCVAGLVLELSSGDFFIMCFAIGSLASLVCSLLGISITWQIIVFAIISVLCLFFVRPFVLKHLHRDKNERLSNADALIGQQGRVSESIEAGGFGRVAIDGDDWKAVSADGNAIAEGTRVRVTHRESIIITVTPD
ncbi:MAG: NfeD family protein [Muribaculaceae bacterium]|nr:NfeD family protein [Muribaculaceae bacterium]